ncbi:EF-hand domain-containing protein [Limnoglobus roseus]|uniref:EF-hand domain-containing protein n=1 Tax=Limnoglobus roseus TaxID=2598579 RepID=A0A5C1A6V3_9BACT|nr:hypothetical protein [Limnoglobus roseus]QEL13716.1 EF-hand domain-containing protein [Limnoglobus roseus]
MRLLKLFKLMAPIGLAVFALSMNPDDSQGQFPGGGGGGPGGGKGSKGGRDSSGKGGGQPGGFGGQDAGGGRGGPGGFGGGQGGFGGGQPGGFGGQDGGGGRGGRGGNFGGGQGGGATSFADGQFAQLQASYGGSGNTLDYSLIPAATRERSNAMAQRFGGEPMPTSGTITIDQYRDASTKRMEAMRAQRGGGGGGPMGSPMATSTDPRGGGFPGGDRGGRGGPGGDQSGLGSLSRYDMDRDGRISLQEAQSTDRLKFVFDQYDANRDGFIDAAEAQAYSADSGSRRNADPYGQGRDGRDQQGGWGNWGGDGRGQIPQEDPKPIVLRFGKLPKDLPSWFKQLDTDEDGQVGLYEWRRDGRKSEEFMAMDLNSDGLLTAEEYLRYKNPNFTMASLAPKPERGGRGGFGGDSADRGGDRGDRSLADDRRSSGDQRSPWGGSSGDGSSEKPEKAEKAEKPKAERPSGGLSSLFGGGSRGEAAAANKEKDSKKDDKKGNSRSKNGPGGPGGR